ncbi:MAG: hypothetical protein H6R40_547 [Gemmatimonadetes bacterium]|nr:hypothetical protein [Gemmatimonadota bacterium]
MTFRRLHLLVGLATVVLFGLTGLYLRFRYDDLRGMTDATRLLFRSTQTYLLLSGLLNVGLGLYLAGESGRGRERTGENGRERERRGDAAAGGTAAGLLRGIGSVLILIGPLLFLAGFLREPFLGALARPFSTPALYAALAGMALHWLASEREDS